MANRRMKATEVEKFYIEGNPDGLSPEQLSQKFELNLKTVIKIQQEVAERKSVEQVEEQKQSERSVARDMMTFKPDKSKPGKITIMTEGASQRAENAAKLARGNLKNQKYKNDFTTKTFPDEE